MNVDIDFDLQEQVEQALFGDPIDDYGTRLCSNDIAGDCCGSCVSDAFYGEENGGGYEKEICCVHAMLLDEIIEELKEPTPKHRDKDERN